MGKSGRRLPMLLAAALGLVLACAGCKAAAEEDPSERVKVDPDAEKMAEVSADLLVADEHQIYSVLVSEGVSRPFHRIAEPISGMCRDSRHTIVTVSGPDAKGREFRGFYDMPAGSGHFVRTAAPFAPQWSYVRGDLLFLGSAEADMTEHPDGKYSKAAVYQLAEHRWIRQWEIPGGIKDVKGRGDEVYVVTGNNKTVPSNVYKADIRTGEEAPLIQKPRWYPLDRVMPDPDGQLYLAITQRDRSEWSNKIYRYNPAQVPYELFDGFLSNTRPNSYDLTASQGKIFIARYDVTGENAEIEQPLAVLDVKTRRQVYAAWDHRPVQIGVLDGRFVALGEDGAVALVDPNKPGTVERSFQVEGLEDAKWMAVKGKDTQ